MDIIIPGSIDKVGRFVEKRLNASCELLQQAWDCEDALRVIRFGQVELALMATIGTNRMKEWLPQGQAKSNKYVVGNYSIVTRPHRDSVQNKQATHFVDLLIKTAKAMEVAANSFNAAPEQYYSLQLNYQHQYVQAVNHLTKFHQLLDKHGAALLRAAEEMPQPSRLNFGEIWDERSNKKIRRFSFCMLYREINFLPSLEDALDDLTNLLGLSDIQPLAPPPIDGRTRWRQVTVSDRKETTTGALESALISSMSVNDSDYRQYSPDDVDIPKESPCFRDHYGRILMRFDKVSFGGNALYTPISFWRKTPFDRVWPVYVPWFSKPYPLMNSDRLHQYPDATVIITDSIEAAAILNSEFKPVPEKPLPDDSVVTTWYGGAATVQHVDWRQLTKRKVIYLMIDHAETARGKMYSTFIEVKKEIEPLTKFFVAYKYQPERGIRKGQMKRLDKYDISEAVEQYNIRPMTSIVSAQHGQFDRSACTLSESANSEPKEYLVDPVIAKGTLSLAYSNPGVGKTWFCLAIAMALAKGGTVAGNWRATKPHRVFYVDGEMGDQLLKSRVEKTARALGIKLDSRGVNKRFYYKSLAKERLDLSTPEGQGRMTELLKGIAAGERNGYPSLLVLDSLVSLNGFSDSAANWNRLFDWLSPLRQRGIAVILVHHANKTGAQRGTDLKTAAADNVLFLEKQKGRTDSDIALAVHIEKGRELYGAAKRPLKVHITPSARKPKWQVMRMTPEERPALPGSDAERRDMILELQEQGLKVEEIARELGMGRTTLMNEKKRLGLTRPYHREKSGKDQKK